MKIQIPKARTSSLPAVSTDSTPSRPFQVDAQPAQGIVPSSQSRLQLGELPPADHPLPGPIQRKMESRAAADGNGVAQLQGGGLLGRLGGLLASASRSSSLGFTPQRNYHVGYRRISAEELKRLRSSLPLYYRGVSAEFADHAPLAPQYRGMSKEDLEGVSEEATTPEEATLHAGSETPYGVSVATSPSATLGYGGKGRMIQIINALGMPSTSQGDPALTERVYKNRIDESRVEGVISEEELTKHLDAEKDTPESKAKREAIERMKALQRR